MSIASTSNNLWIIAKRYKFRKGGRSDSNFAVTVPADVLANFNWQPSDDLRLMLDQSDKSVKVVNLSLQEREKDEGSTHNE